MFSISDSHRWPMQAYKTSVQQLLPSWASAMGDPQEATAERHLGELQFNIEATGVVSGCHSCRCPWPCFQTRAWNNENVRKYNTLEDSNSICSQFVFWGGIYLWKGSITDMMMTVIKQDAAQQVYLPRNWHHPNFPSNKCFFEGLEDDVAFISTKKRLVFVLSLRQK